MDAQTRNRLIDRYTAAIDAIVVAVDHTDADDLDARPAPKAWSAREIIHHLADAELQDAIRLRRMLAENTPVLAQWDEDRYAQRLHYDRPIDPSLEAVRSLAISNIQLLNSLSQDEWRREGNRQRPWPLTIEEWLEEKVGQLHERLMQLLNAPTGGRAIPDPEDRPPAWLKG
jgi:hypothetical protein